MAEIVAPRNTWVLLADQHKRVADYAFSLEELLVRYRTFEWQLWSVGEGIEFTASALLSSAPNGKSHFQYTIRRNP